MSDGARMGGVPEAQQDPVLKRYPLRRCRLPVGGSQLSLVVPDDRAWMRRGDWTSAVLKGREPPYWCRIWPAAVSIARQLARTAGQQRTLLAPLQNPLRNLRVLDLGCGLGVPGAQAAALGADLCSVDFEKDALSFAQWNAANQPSCGKTPTSQHVDWAKGAVAGTFDLVLLSDVTYHESHHGPLRQQLERVLSPHGAVLHADPERELSTSFLESLGGQFAQHAWIRRTAFFEHDAMVRLTLLARTPADLQSWAERLAVALPSSDDRASGHSAADG